MTQDGRKHVGERRLPAWLALVLVLLFAGGAIYGIWRMMQTEKRGVETVAIDAPARGERLRRGPAGVEPNDPRNAKVFRRNDGMIRAISDNYTLLVDAKDKGGEMTLQYADGENWLTRQQLMVLRIAERSQQARREPRGMQLTEEQRKQSKLVTGDPVMAMNDEDRAKLNGLVSAWEAADAAGKLAAQNALLDGLREVARRNEKAARREYLANIDKLAAMLRPEQMEQYQKMQGGRRPGRNG